MKLEVYVAPFEKEEGAAIHRCPECDRLQSQLREIHRG